MISVPYWISLPISGMFCLSQLYTGMCFGNIAKNKIKENKTKPKHQWANKQTPAASE